MPQIYRSMNTIFEIVRTNVTVFILTENLKKNLSDVSNMNETIKTDRSSFMNVHLYSCLQIKLYDLLPYKD